MRSRWRRRPYRRMTMRITDRLEIRPSFFVFWTAACLLDADGTLPLFVLAAAVHELGHAAAVYLAGGRVERMVLYAAGACMQVRHGRGYTGDLVIAAAGPLAGALAAWISAQAGWVSFAGANLILSLFNCLPIVPLDGGCMLSCLLCLSPLGLRGGDVLRALSLVQSLVLTGVGVGLLMRTGNSIALLVIGLMLTAGNLGCGRMPLETNKISWYTKASLMKSAEK